MLADYTTAQEENAPRRAMLRSGTVRVGQALKLVDDSPELWRVLPD